MNHSEGQLTSGCCQAMQRAGCFTLTVACLLVLARAASGQVHVLTQHNDLARTGLNANETQLTPANVNTNTFGQLFSYPVDGQVYAQPLYVSGLAIPGQGTRNVIFIATQHNSVYALDADSNAGPGGGLIWHTHLGPAAATPSNDFGNRYGPYSDIRPEVGITSTPVIDLTAGTIYVDAFTHEGAAYYHRIHALNITNGTEQPYSPMLVTASVPGRGVGSVNGTLAFNAKQHVQRAALTLAGGVLYAAFAGYGDTDPYHGWVIGFDARNLQRLTNYVFNVTPNSTMADFGANAGEGGIWMSGAGMSVDANTNLYFIVGNGIFNANTNGTEYGDSFLKLSTANGLAVADYFTPFNQQVLADNDWDLGSGGAVLLPDEVGSAAHPHLLAGCGKEGRIYLLDRDNLGHFNPTNDSQVVQSLPRAANGTWSSPAYFNGKVYFQGAGDVLKAFEFANGLLISTPASRTTMRMAFPGATPAISANGTNDAIVWEVQIDGSSTGLPAILHAWAATNLAVELYNSSQAGTRDTLGPAVKYAVPTIANGKVYVGASHEVDVLGGRENVPPSLAITSHTNLQEVAATKITLVGTASDAGSGDSGIASVTINGVPASNGQTTGSDTAQWSCAVTLASGTNLFRVSAQDAYGNATSASIQLISDTTPPSVAITAPVTGQRWSNNVVSVRGTAKDNRQVTAVWCQINGVWNLATTTNGWTNWTASVPALPGNNVIRACSQDCAGNCSSTNTVAGFLSVTNPLVVQAAGLGTLAPNYNHRLLEIGRSYTITATPGAGYLFSNWIGSALAQPVFRANTPRLTFMMQSNLVLQANFIPNPFLRAAGTYQGLFYDPNSVAPQSSGFFSALVTPNGTFSARLQQGLASYPIAGRFSIDGSLQANALTARGKTAMWLQLDLATAEGLSGTLSNANWTAELWAYRGVYSRTNPAPQGGHYTLVLPGTNSTSLPAGHGFGIVSVDASGNVSFTGTLGDGTKVAQTIPLSSQGQWPFYQALYSGNGSALGCLWFTNLPDRDIDGWLSWIKFPGGSMPLYRAGFTNLLEPAGSHYAFTNSARVLNLTNGTLVLANGNLPDSITNQFVLQTNNLVVGSNKLSLKISTASGLFQGSTTNGAGRTISFSGALLQKQNAGFGQFLGTNQTGSVSLQPR